MSGSRAQQVRALVEQGDVESLRALVREDVKAIRHLVGMTYHADEAIRQRAADGIAFAATVHPATVRRVVNRLVRAMSDEGATNGTSAPLVLLAIAETSPEMLVPIVPDLTRLAGDRGLNRGLARTLRRVADRCPGQVGHRLSKSLTERAKRATKIGANRGH